MIKIERMQRHMYRYYKKHIPSCRVPLLISTLPPWYLFHQWRPLPLRRSPLRQKLKYVARSPIKFAAFSLPDLFQNMLGLTLIIAHLLLLLSHLVLKFTRVGEEKNKEVVRFIITMHRRQCEELE